MRLLTAVLLAGTLAPMSLAAPAAAQVLPMQAVVPDGTILDVDATGKVTRTPDLATVRAGVVTQDATAATALSQNSARMARVVAALRQAGIASRDIATSNVSLQPQYRYAENQPPAITGYQASNSVSVRFRDVAKAGPVLDALVTAGANQIDGPALSIAEPDVALDEARAQAMRQARARAELYARAAGLRVDRIVSISESGENSGGGPRPPVVYARAAMAEAAPTQVLAGETDVTVSLAVRFLLK